MEFMQNRRENLGVEVGYPPPTWITPRGLGLSPVDCTDFGSKLIYPQPNPPVSFVLPKKEFELELPVYLSYCISNVKIFIL
jgi:hypothetical protein